MQVIKCLTNECKSAISLTPGKLYLGEYDGHVGRDMYSVLNDQGVYQAYRASRFQAIDIDEVKAIYKGTAYAIESWSVAHNTVILVSLVDEEKSTVKITDCELTIKQKTAKRKSVKAKTEPVNNTEAIEVTTNTNDKVYIDATGIKDANGNSLMPTWELASGQYDTLSLGDKEGTKVFDIKQGGINFFPKDFVMQGDVLYASTTERQQLEKGNILVNVLGTDYVIKFRSKDDDEHLVDSLGYTDFYKKEIIVADDLLQYGGTDDKVRNELVNNHTIRHEIVHAFFFESGLDGSSDYARNEELVDWIAIQLPKLCRMFSKLGVM